jgi:hypothetical protein
VHGWYGSGDEHERDRHAHRRNEQNGKARGWPGRCAVQSHVGRQRHEHFHANAENKRHQAARSAGFGQHEAQLTAASF